MGDPEILNTHPHSEQPQPLKSGFSIHTSVRLMASLTRLAIRCGYGFLKNGVAFVFDGTAMAKTGLFVALSEVLPKSTLFEQSSKRK